MCVTASLWGGCGNSAGITIDSRNVQAPPIEEDKYEDRSERIDIVCEPLHYVAAYYSGKPRIVVDPDEDEVMDIDGFIMRILKPDNYAGKIFTIHHDGFLASGDPREVFAMGKKYAFTILRSWIGKNDYRMCSVGWERQVIDR
jgi:hypothetical protein